MGYTLSLAALMDASKDDGYYYKDLPRWEAELAELHGSDVSVRWEIDLSVWFGMRTTTLRDRLEFLRYARGAGGGYEQIVFFANRRLARGIKARDQLANADAFPITLWIEDARKALDRACLSDYVTGELIQAAIQCSLACACVQACDDLTTFKNQIDQQWEDLMEVAG